MVPVSPAGDLLRRSDVLDEGSFGDSGGGVGVGLFEDVTRGLAGTLIISRREGVDVEEDRVGLEVGSGVGVLVGG
jgi:hypothetical protein